MPRKPALTIGNPERFWNWGAPIAGLHSECVGRTVSLASDRDETTRWVCPPGGPRQELIVDLGRPEQVGAYVQNMGEYSWEAPRWLVIETSLDHHAWSEAWNGSVLELTIEAAMRDPRSLRIVVPLPARQARYVRMRVEQQEPGFHLTIPEVEVRRPAP